MTERNIKQETRSRNLIHHSQTINLICDVIYKETGCEECRKGHFCSRDGKDWCCLPYGTIADRLNTDTDHRTSRGGLWQTKTISDQILRRTKKVTPEEKEEWIEQQNKLRNQTVIWEHIPIETLVGDDAPDIEELLARTELMSNIQDIDDVETFIDELRDYLTNKVEKGLELSILLTQSKPKK